LLPGQVRTTASSVRRRSGSCGNFERFESVCVSPRRKRVYKASTTLVCSLISRLKRPGNRALQPFWGTEFRGGAKLVSDSSKKLPPSLNVPPHAASLPA
jgi:hypothetical protein